MSNLEYQSLLFISPHHDDVAFSVSGIVQSLSKISNLTLFLANIFSVSNHIKSKSILATQNGSVVDFATNIRKNEDERFCKKYNISYLNMDFEEAAIFCNPFDTSVKEDSFKISQSLLVNEIKKLVVKEKTILFVPLGIGKHKDHLKAFNFVKLKFKNIKSNNFVFYEDSPYMSYNVKREERLAEVRNFLKNNNFERVDFYLGQEFLLNKVDDIKIYRSQLADDEYDNFNIKRYCHFDGNHYETLWICNENVKKFLLNNFGCRVC